MRLGARPVVAARPDGPDVWWIPWPDFGLPHDPRAALDVLASALAAATEQRVVLSCRGGRGRTGTALAALAVLSGVPASDAVAWVRERYHPRAVETQAQRRWILDLGADPATGSEKVGR